MGLIHNTNVNNYLFYGSLWSIQDVIIPIVDVELSHIILLVMLTLFGIGVLKVDK
jgi:hypothetical protein